MIMLYVFLGLTMLTSILFMLMMVGLIVISKKTHAITELKAFFKGVPVSIYFQDNLYCDWKVDKPDAGLIENKDYGTFVIDKTYIDKKTKNVLIPFNTSYATSLNVKAVKLTDDLGYLLKEQQHRKILKDSIIKGKISETDGIDTLRTSVNFSSIKSYVAPILPHNIQSKIVATIFSRIDSMGGSQFQNILLLVVSALGAIILGGIILRFVVFNQ